MGKDEKIREIEIERWEREEWRPFFTWPSLHKTPDSPLDSGVSSISTRSSCSINAFFQNDFVCVLLASPAEAAPGKYSVTFYLLTYKHCGITFMMHLDYKGTSAHRK